MAQRAEAFRSGRFYLPTTELTDTSTKFGNISPAFNNSYDVIIDIVKGNIPYMIEDGCTYKQYELIEYKQLEDV